MSDDCLFCRIVDGEIPSVRVAEDERTVAFMDLNPATDGHLLVVPKRHARDLVEIAPDDLAAVTRTAQRIAVAALPALGADGVNLLNCCGESAWQSVFHFHLHLVPRYADHDKDTLVLPWRPGIPGDPDRIAETGARLAAALADQPRPG